MTERHNAACSHITPVAILEIFLHDNEAEVWRIQGVFEEWQKTEMTSIHFKEENEMEAWLSVSDQPGRQS